MKAIIKFLAGGAAIAAFASAAPASAQYYPGYGGYSGYGGYGGYGGTGNVVGAIINSVIGGGFNGYAPYGNNAMSQAVVNQCANAVQARLSGGGYGYGGAYGGYGGYGGAYGGYAGGYGGGRVVGISRVESGAMGAIKVRGVASSGGAYGQAGAVDLVWKCKADPSGRIIDLQVSRPQSNYGYNMNQYTPWNDYSQYGYRRY